jgi:hypothetical protein
MTPHQSPAIGWGHNHIGEIMAHPDKSHRIAAIYRAWRNGKLSEPQVMYHMERLGVLNTALIWFRNPVPPRYISWTIDFMGRHANAQGVFFAQRAQVLGISTPTVKQAIEVLGQIGYEINHITRIKQGKYHASQSGTAIGLHKGSHLH